MNCQEVRESFEPFLDEELSVEMLNKVKLHVAECSACDNLVGLRERFDARLRNAIVADARLSPDPKFVARLRSEFSPKSRRSFTQFGSDWRSWFASGLAAALLVAVGTYFVAFRSGDSETIAVTGSTTTTQAPLTIPSAVPVPASFRTLVNTAVEEHKSCTLTNLTSHHQAAYDPGTIFLGDQKLDEAVRSAVQQETKHDISTAASHFCDVDGQTFRHLILKEGVGYISVLVTDAGSRQQDENAIFCETIDGSSVACFKSQRKTVFVVSERSEEANLKLAQSITPTVRSALDRTSPL
ncbi:MAG TPA: zf-HC2 domain-containing protein [Pyrinomonadaceae bacterium]|nr:zf-HC2 domain-containing protein [Pyrinomonadaceae bacterium]